MRKRDGGPSASKAQALVCRGLDASPEKLFVYRHAAFRRGGVVDELNSDGVKLEVES